MSVHFFCVMFCSVSCLPDSPSETLVWFCYRRSLQLERLILENCNSIFKSKEKQNQIPSYWRIEQDGSVNSVILESCPQTFKKLANR